MILRISSCFKHAIFSLFQSIPAKWTLPGWLSPKTSSEGICGFVTSFSSIRFPSAAHQTEATAGAAAHFFAEYKNHPPSGVLLSIHTFPASFIFSLGPLLQTQKTVRTIAILPPDFIKLSHYIIKPSTLTERSFKGKLVMEIIRNSSDLPNCYDSITEISAGQLRTAERGNHVIIL